VKNEPEERLYYLDGLRSFLIILVVLLHVSQIYNPNHTWNIYFEDGSILVSYMVDFLGLLCMPTFFMIAGYFSVVSFKHSHKKNFLIKRIRRLLLPLMTIALTLNLLQAYILVGTGWKDYSISTYISEGIWISHLWFLINLIVYTIISYIFIRYFKAQTKKILLFIIDKMNNISIYVVLFILPIISIALLASFKLIPGYIYGINIYAILSYTPFYLFGILLMLNKTLLNKFSHISIFVSLTIVVVAFIIFTTIKGIEAKEYKIVYFYFKGLATWFTASLAFTLFKKYLNRKSEVIFKISDASYTIYLVHHVLVIILGIVFINLELNFIIGLPTLFTTVVLFSYFFHRKIVLKIGFLQLLLNGQVNKR